MEKANRLYGKRIKDLRTDHDMSQEDIAEVCNVSDATVGHWENSRRDLSLDCLIKIAKYFDVSTDYILGLTDNPDKFWK